MSLDSPADSVNIDFFVCVFITHKMLNLRLLQR